MFSLRRGGREGEKSMPWLGVSVAITVQNELFTSEQPKAHTVKKKKEKENVPVLPVKEKQSPKVLICFS